jgi:SAM-dependent methyltransferase
LLARNDIASDRLVNATGERLPFDTGSMDLVVSFDVLEHVQSPLAVLKESLRVLKPGGLLYGFAGTSGYWWEWHYAIPWIPGLPRWLARHWVRSFGRNPAFLDELNLLSTPRFKRQLRSLEGCMLERFCSETRLPPAATECLTWLNSVQQTELVAQTGAARGSPLGLRWCRLVMHPAIRLACGAFSIHPVLEFVIRKTAH